VNDLAGFCIGHDGADRDMHDHIVPVPAVAIAAFAVTSSASFVLRIETKLKEGVQLIGRLE
jgi:hypothetical protein